MSLVGLVSLVGLQKNKVSLFTLLCEIIAKKIF